MKIVGAGLALLLLTGTAMAQTAASAPDTQQTMEAQPRPMGPEKSARFRLKVGDIALGLTCPDDEPLKACADFAMQLLDKLQTMEKH